MLETSFSSALEEKLTAMLERMDNIGYEIVQELHDWQVEDMHRKYPNISQAGDAVSTKVWPRSRTNTPRRRAIAKSGGKAKSSKGRTYIRRQRPILRPMLIESLRERMHALAERTMSWQ
jgi:hypothetical protein